MWHRLSHFLVAVVIKTFDCHDGGHLFWRRASEAEGPRSACSTLGDMRQSNAYARRPIAAAHGRDDMYDMYA